MNNGQGRAQFSGGVGDGCCGGGGGGAGREGLVASDSAQSKTAELRINSYLPAYI